MAKLGAFCRRGTAGACLLALLAAMALAGCGKKQEAGIGAPSPASFAPPPPMARKALAAGVAQEVLAEPTNRYLAYEHSLSLDVPQQQVAAVFEAAQAACRAAAADLCVVLNSRLNTGRSAHATLRLRAKPSGISKLIAVLGQQGDITARSTTAEDLSGPIADTDKQLALLSDYRAKLEALRARASSDVDALIKVNHELAQVQSQLEDFSGNRAKLMRRVDTEILDVDIGSRQNESFWRPLAQAVQDFGGNLAQGASSVVTGMAFLLPWGLVLGLLGWGVTRLWRWRRRAKAGNAR
jgi:hypothetical protein